MSLTILISCRKMTPASSSLAGCRITKKTSSGTMRTRNLSAERNETARGRERRKRHEMIKVKRGCFEPGRSSGLRNKRPIRQRDTGDDGLTKTLDHADHHPQKKKAPSNPAGTMGHPDSITQSAPSQCALPRTWKKSQDGGGILVHSAATHRRQGRQAMPGSIQRQGRKKQRGIMKNQQT